MDFQMVLQHGDGVLRSVFVILLLMSMISWTLIASRSWRLWLHRKTNHRWANAFWEAQDLAAAEPLLAEDTAYARTSKVVLAGSQHFKNIGTVRLAHACSFDEHVIRLIRRAIADESSRLQTGLTWLATIGSVAPFVGLFGTVWGIYHALIGMATANQFSITIVAGPIGEALIATAAGLAAAIPAVVAYNALLRANRIEAEKFDGFAHDLHSYVLFQHQHEA